MEGKDLRFGQTGASNAVLESMAPISGRVSIFNLPLGCISPGGVGTGLYSLFLLVFIAAFIGALMIGRTPGHLSKKINARDMQLVMLALLLSPALVLVFAAPRRSSRSQDRARQPRRRRSARPQRDRLRLRLQRRRQRLCTATAGQAARATLGPRIPANGACHARDLGPHGILTSRGRIPYRLLTRAGPINE